MNNLDFRRQSILGGVGREMPKAFRLRPRLVILLGPPGAGKGTQAQRIASEYGLKHLSTGDMLRDNLASDTALGREAKPLIERGELVPDHIVLRMVQDRISQTDCRNGFVLDGFPRTLAQARGLERICRSQRTGCLTALNIVVQPELLARRIANRRICKMKGHIYNLMDRMPIHPGVCDVDGSELVQRPDDRESVVRERIHTYENHAHPLIDYYSARGLLHQVDGAADPDTVTTNLTRVLNDIGQR